MQQLRDMGTKARAVALERFGSIEIVNEDENFSGLGARAFGEASLGKERCSLHKGKPNPDDLSLRWGAVERRDPCRKKREHLQTLRALATPISIPAQLAAFFQSGSSHSHTVVFDFNNELLIHDPGLRRETSPPPSTFGAKPGCVGLPPTGSSQHAGEGHVE